ncbi:MAG: hypothetical protein A2Z91_04240 [Deltaproteobacteria bacterium GWA2_38_16]|nr:MAG: hypothetical protein A2Z91_04240 [Deltaproteobacteria bacterium GWA2_38_16]OGQ01785.1 MAG: hypothetical protein A3D19_07940 [Deltaproteobacteria bacterium RIFCSPHIGHO2_02_FULL_38_15]OGQ58885.1 MAG: hypothetical protein A3G92_07760 [Deltaproteobacteria bacterium RIFCSPLOWO2_12_FULL_38_8]HBQ21407.1 hypothetical protein [Deltaproteobacteria bacterium]
MKHILHIILWGLPNATRPIICFFFLLFSSFSAAAQNFEGALIQKVSIVAPKEFDTSEVIQDLQKLKGSPFLEKKINAKIKALYLSQKFHNISVHLIPIKDNSLELSFVLELSKRIESIEFKGNSLFSSIVLSRTIRSREDSFFSEQAIMDDKTAIENLYQESGYFQTSIQVKFFAPQKPHELHILFEITEGVPAIIEHIIVESIGKPKSKEVRRLLSLDEGDLYYPQEVEQEILSLKKYFFKKRYISAHFSPEKIIFSPDKRKVSLFLTITPGPQFSFEFKGASEFNDYTLLSPIVANEEMLPSVSIEDIVKHIITLYQKEGFFHVRVSYDSFLDEKDNTKKIIFNISESEPVKIRGFIISGNKTFDADYYQFWIKRLSPPIILKKYYSPDDFDELPQLLIDHLKTQGFLFPKVSIQNLNWDMDRKSIEPEFYIEEGYQTFIKDIKLSGNSFFSEKELLEALNLPGEAPLNLFQLEVHLNNILTLYKEHGFLKCQIEHLGTEKLIAYSKDLTFAFLNIHIIEGPQTKIGAILFRGMVRTRNRVLERELTIKKGDVWNPKEIQRSENQLLKLGLFSSLKIRPLKEDFTAGENDVLIEATERMPGLMELGSGYKTDDGIHGFSGLAYRNIGGWNRVVSLRGELNRKIQGYRFLERDIQMGISEPYLGGIPFVARLNASHKKESTLPFDERSWSGKFSLDKGLWDFLRLSIQYLFEYRDIFRAIDIRDVQDKYIASLGPSLLLDFRDNAFNPSRGSSHSISSSFFSPVIGSDPDISFSKTLLSTSWYFTPWPWITLALLGRGGYAHAFFTDFPIPVDQRFYLGGRASIRGFREDIIGSDTKNRQIFETSFINYKSELQFHVYSGFGLAFFFDGGNVFFDNPVKGNKFRNSLGPGLRYDTPIGPLSLDYGFILHHQKEVDEPRGRLHFSIGIF